MTSAVSHPSRPSQFHTEVTVITSILAADWELPHFCSLHILFLHCSLVLWLSLKSQFNSHLYNLPQQPVTRFGVACPIVLGKCSGHVPMIAVVIIIVVSLLRTGYWFIFKSIYEQFFSRLFRQIVKVIRVAT